jgi:NAD(P)-dependent dehydrogenase (short-subunit alcohol dehydrogenase family)
MPDMPSTTVLDRFSLTGKVALVTGASSGLGVAIAQCLAEAGADVVLGARRLDRLQETKRLVEATGRRALAVQTDVVDPEQCTAMVAAAVQELGKVDVLVNNAGVGTAYPATRETPEQFRSVIDLNLNGQYWMAQAFGRAATGGGSIINISSVLGLRPGGIPQAAYASSKAGLLGLTRDLAAQWTGRKGIRVNAICPGYFPSEMTDELDPREGEMVRSLAPAGRYGEPYEVGDACVFLASDASSYITGVSLCVDGGLVMP